MEQEKFETMEKPPVVIAAGLVVTSTFILNLFLSYSRYETLDHIDSAVLFSPILSIVIAILIFEPLFFLAQFLLQAPLRLQRSILFGTAADFYPHLALAVGLFRHCVGSISPNRPVAEHCAAPLAVEAVLAHLVGPGSVTRVVFCCFSQGSADLHHDALRAHGIAPRF